MLLVWQSRALEKGLPNEELRVECVKKRVKPAACYEQVGCNVAKCVGDMEVDTSAAFVA